MSFRQGTWLAAALAIPTLLIAANFAPLFLPRFSMALAGGAPLKVMSYNLVDSYLNNAQWEAGWGLGFTFPAHAPALKKCRCYCQ